MSSWRESAGRKEGNEGYRFGDLTRTLVKKLIVGGEEAVESKLPSRIARTVKRLPYKYMTDSGLASDFWTIRWVE